MRFENMHGPALTLFAAPLLLCLAATAAGEDGASAVVAGELGSRLDAVVAKYGGGEYWGGVLVSRGGEVLLAKGYGFADYDDTPNTRETIFELASASKQVTAAAILHLEQRGKLSVDDSVGRFFDKLPADKRAITVHHLLTHTSGISPKLGVPYASTIGRDAYVERMLTEPLTAEPGETFRYSNAGYALLAAIVEVAGKTKFETYCEKHLFKPAGMVDTGFIGDRDLVKTGRLSTRKTEEPGRFTAAEWHWGWGYRGMGGVVTTVGDLLKWDQALDGDDLLTEASKRKLYTPALQGYAYGWRVTQTERGTRKAHHSGSVRGYGTSVVRFLEEDVCIFVLSNDARLAGQVSAGLEQLLFAPQEISIELDTTTYGRPPNKAWFLPAALQWAVSGRGSAIHAVLRDGEHTVADIGLPLPVAQKLIADLEKLLAARSADDPGGTTSKFQAMLAFPEAATSYAQDGDLSVRVVEEDAGRGAPADEREMCAKLVVGDARTGRFPVLSLMNFTASRALLAGLREAVAR